MRRPTLLLPALAFLVLLGGCSVYGYEDIFRDRYPGDRYPYPDRRDGRTSRYYDRVDGDVYRYTRTVQQEVGLDRRQAERVDRLLRDRTYDLLERTSSYRHNEVYPFPRRYDRERNRAVRSWWASTDRRIERELSREQRRRYEYLVEGRRYDRDRRYRDDRYRSPRGRTYDRDDRYRRGDDDDDD